MTSRPTSDPISPLSKPAQSSPECEPATLPPAVPAGEAEDLLGKYAWLYPNSLGRSHPVGWIRPNDLGLFDLHGNMWEWCQDRVGGLGPKEPGKGVKPEEDLEVIVDDKSSRLLRGGSFLIQPVYVRSALRSRYAPAFRNSLIGFRPARTFTTE